MSDDPSTEELHGAQRGREQAERERARHADDPDDAHAHDRRADKAAYLSEKLEQRERAESERD